MLQWLRDADKVEFLGNGVYRITDELESVSTTSGGSILDELEPELQDLDFRSEGTEP